MRSEARFAATELYVRPGSAQVTERKQGDEPGIVLVTNPGGLICHNNAGTLYVYGMRLAPSTPGAAMSTPGALMSCTLPATTPQISIPYGMGVLDL